jgi:hypothetical protein
MLREQRAPFGHVLTNLPFYRLSVKRLSIQPFAGGDDAEQLTTGAHSVLQFDK